MNDAPTLARGAVAVVVRGPEDAVTAARAHAPSGVPVLAIGGSDAEAAQLVAPADLVLVAPDVVVGPGWLDGLLAAAGDDGTVATVSALALPDGARAGDRPLRPRTVAPLPGAVLVRRAALELCGPLDEGFASRATAAGLLHVLADDVVVTGPEQPVPEDEPEPAARARWRALQRSRELSVTVDGRILRDPIAGTQVHTLELLAALHRTQRLRLRVLLAESVTDTARTVLDTLDGLEHVNQADVVEAPETAVVHRPYQVSSAADLLTLRHVGDRLVVTHQDLLGFHNPTYHEDRTTWLDYRRLTRTALGAAHAVVAFSQHAGQDLRAEDLVTPDRLRVVEIGVDHRLGQLAREPRRPDLPLGDAPYLLCLGTDLRHKNRVFALALLRELRALGWDGRLVLAGSKVAEGSSAAEEQALLAADPGLRAAVIDGGVPDEAEKAWLYAHAAAALYPTVYEGFGLIPFEAAAHGVPTLFAAQASLADTLADAATLIPWDARASAAATIGLLEAGAARERHVATVRAAADRLTWDATAHALLDVYEDTLALPHELGWNALQVEAERREWEHRYWLLFNGIGPTGLSLVNGDERLLPEDAQRTLSALLQRSVTRRPLLSALGGLRKVIRR